MTLSTEKSVIKMESLDSKANYEAKIRHLRFRLQSSSKMLTAARPVAARFLLTQSSLNRAAVKPNTLSRTMGTIADGVVFDTIAREWRCKWSADGDKASLVAAQKLLSETLPAIKAIDGVKGVQRIVCGGCLDFKIITSLDAAKWGDFESGGHGPEAEFLEKLKAIDGITEVETQTYTIMPM